MQKRTLSDESLRQTILARMITLACLVVAAVAIPGVPSRGMTTAVLLVAFPTQFLLQRWSSKERLPIHIAIHDIMLASLLAVIVPDIWTAAVITISAALVWLGLVTDVRVMMAVGAPAITALAFAGWRCESPLWLPTIITAVCVTCSFGMNGLHHQGARRQLEQDLGAVLDSAGAALHVCDLHTGRVLRVAGPIERVAGRTAEEWTAPDHKRLLHPEDAATYWIDVDTATNGQRFDRTARFLRSDGTWAWLREVSKATITRDGVAELRGLTIDVSALSQALSEAEYRGSYDQLTGLGNRSHFTDLLRARMDAGDRLVVFLIDLNRFKEINDTLGHEFGDRMLIALAARMRTCMAPGATIARLGGDEFGIIARLSTVGHDPESEAERLAAILREPIDLDGVRVAASGAIGVVSTDDGPESAAVMMRCADIAMYAAKARGVAVCRFTGDLEQTSITDVLLSGQIGAAIDAGEIVVHLQPKVDLLTGVIVGAEALARWQHPEYGLLGAEDFIHLVSVSDQESAFTAHIVREALRTIVQFRESEIDLELAINVTVRSLADTAFTSLVAASCAEFGVRPSMLTFELTEDAAMETSGVVPAALRELDELGVRLSIDDFGAGHSSFARLPNLPIDEIKIDRQFLWSMAEEPRNGVILTSIIDLARGLGHQVVAEGVESAEHAEFLAAHGCDVGQGYYFGAPLPANEFRDRVSGASDGHDRRVTSRHPGLRVAAATAPSARLHRRGGGHQVRFERDEIEAAFAEFRRRGEGSHDWPGWAALFTENALYEEHHLGRFRGRQAIADFIIPTMRDYPSMTLFIEWYQIEDNRVAFYIWNNLPDPSGADRSFQFPNTTILQYAGDGLWDWEADFYNPADAEKVFGSWLAAGGRKHTPQNRSLGGVDGWAPEPPTTVHSRDEVDAEFQKYRERGRIAVATGDWNQWADQFTDDARYLEHHYGRFNGQTEIREWITGVMQPFPAMEFPTAWYSIDGNRVCALIPNVLPDPAGVGDYYGFDVFVILHYAGNGRWSYEEDVYNPREAQQVISNWIAAGGEVPKG